VQWGVHVAWVGAQRLPEQGSAFVQREPMRVDRLRAVCAFDRLHEHEGVRGAKKTNGGSLSGLLLSDFDSTSCMRALVMPPHDCAHVRPQLCHRGRGVMASRSLNYIFRSFCSFSGAGSAIPRRTSW
jgi:hypothetical protein